MAAFNFCTMVQYSGGNSLLKGNGKYNAFATFNQIQANGFKVNKGAHGVKIFTGVYIKKDEKTGEETRVPKYAIVFDIVNTNALEDKNFQKVLASVKPTAAGDAKHVDTSAPKERKVKATVSERIKAAGLNMPSNIIVARIAA